jgi:CspA family cold shock protein
MTERQYGVGRFFLTDKGYGFIKPDNSTKDIFVHISHLKKAGLLTIEEGKRYSFDIGENKGKPQAINIELDD